jgi:putative sugar O-methyltransferase
VTERIVDAIPPASMEAFYHLQGEFDEEKTTFGEDYYRLRGIWLDCRGTLKIHKTASLEWGIRIVTLSHPVEFQGHGGPNTDRPVIIDEDAWICSFATLFNCHIGEGAIVALGSVVRSQDVPPWTMVAGNPVKIIARFDHNIKRWIYLDEPEEIPQRNAVYELRKEVRENTSELDCHGCVPAEQTWRSHVNKIRQLILEDDPERFLTWHPIISTMAAIGHEDWAKTIQEHLAGLPDWERWRDVIKESSVGSPIRYYKPTNTTMQAMTAAVTLAQFEQSTGRKINEQQFIFEFGGGYGRLCHMLRGLGFKGVYVDFDFPVMTALKRYYLTKVGIHDVTLVSDVNDLAAVLRDVPEHSMFISTWALSEAPLSLRGQIMPLINEFSNFLISYQEHYEGINNLEYFAEMQTGMKDVYWWQSHVPGPESEILMGARR